MMTGSTYDCTVVLDHSSGSHKALSINYADVPIIEGEKSTCCGGASKYTLESNGYKLLRSFQ